MNFQRAEILLARIDERVRNIHNMLQNYPEITDQVSCNKTNIVWMKKAIYGIISVLAAILIGGVSWALWK